MLAGLLTAGESIEISIRETAVLDRTAEYVTANLQIQGWEPFNGLYLTDLKSGEKIYAQLFDVRNDTGFSRTSCQIIFPVDLASGATRIFRVSIVPDKDETPAGLLQLKGTYPELIVENEFYIADLRRDDSEEGKMYGSAQLTALQLKDHPGIVLKRTQNRMHWAPNFQRSGAESYMTIAHWDPPDSMALDAGPYLIRLFRRGRAPGLPEIELTAVYYFFAGKPYIGFFSEMYFNRCVSLSLLRNDEMTMDSLFTHVAFLRSDGSIEDLAFTEREKVLSSDPIGIADPWLCFYHRDQRYALGSIRILYDILDDQGMPSPTFHPYTKISNGANGGKYWNRRLVDERDTFIPAGSRYREKNAYLSFDIREGDRFVEIQNWTQRLRNPVEVQVKYISGTQNESN
jgi:hypothetical protein